MEAGGFNVGDTDANDLLEQGETWQYEATGTSEPDQYTNFSIVRGQGQVSGPVRDIDPSHFFGEQPGIHLEKLTNGVDADLPDAAVYVEVGGEVVWTFRVSNTATSRSPTSPLPTTRSATSPARKPNWRPTSRWTARPPARRSVARTRTPGP